MAKADKSTPATPPAAPAGAPSEASVLDEDLGELEGPEQAVALLQAQVSTLEVELAGERAAHRALAARYAAVTSKQPTPAGAPLIGRVPPSGPPGVGGKFKLLANLRVSNGGGMTTLKAGKIVSDALQGPGYISKLVEFGAQLEAV